MNTTTLILLALLIPLLAAASCLALNHHRNLRDAIGLGWGSIMCIIVVILFVQHDGHDANNFVLFELARGLDIAFSLEPLGAMFALIAGGLWPLAILYSIGYLRSTKEKNHTRFFVFFAIAIHAAIGIALAANLLTLFLFYEILTFSTYPLIVHKNTPEARRAGRLYLGILVSSSVMFLLPAITIVWVYADTLDFKLGGTLSTLPVEWIPWLLALFAFGCAKAALMPLHRWLPAAMIAPTPVSALLHAVAVVKAGVFTILKIITYIFGIDLLSTTNSTTWLIAIASFTIITASITALRKRNLKARLAYSTISQLAYVVLGGALATTLAAQGAALHIVMHAAGKITLFFCAGAIYVTHRITEIDDLDGIGRKMPITFAAFTLGALAIIGIPPMGGSISKAMLIGGAIDANAIIIIGVLIVSSLLNLYYLGEPILRGFFPVPTRNAKVQPTRIEEAPITCLIPLVITAIIALALFFYAENFMIAFENTSQ